MQFDPKPLLGGCHPSRDALDGATERDQWFQVLPPHGGERSPGQTAAVGAAGAPGTDLETPMPLGNMAPWGQPKPLGLLQHGGTSGITDWGETYSHGAFPTSLHFSFNFHFLPFL